MAGRSWRVSLAWTMAVVGVPAAAAPQDVTTLVGARIAEVRVISSGEPVRDARVLALVDLAPGDVVDPVRIREHLFHLVNLNRFDDVIVEAASGQGGVVLTYTLVPLRTLDRVEFRGTLGLDEGALRSVLRERFDRVPSVPQIAASERSLRVLLADRGYLSARVSGAIEPARSAQRAVLVFDVDAGPRSRIRTVEVAGSPHLSRQELLTRLELRPGAPFDRQAIDRRIAREVESLKRRGRLEARITASEASPEPGVVDIVLEVMPGPLVDLVFAGDAIDRDVRDELVPVVREGSVDEDLLEDAQRALERYLRDQGYRRARVAYRRDVLEERLVVTFTVERGRVSRVAGLTISGNRSIPTPELAALVPIAPNAVFVESVVDATEAAVRQYYLDRGFSRVRVAVTAETVAPTGNELSEEQVELVQARVVVDEGPAARIADVSFPGREAFAESVLRETAGLEPGAPFVERAVAAARDGVTRLYSNAGFRSVAVEPSVTIGEDDTSAHVTLEIAEGPRLLVGKVLVTGNERIATATIARELNLVEGQPLGTEQVVDAQRRVAALGLFRRVEVSEVGEPGSHSRDVVVRVEESPPTTIAYGGGIEAGTRFAADTQDAPGTERLEFAWRTFFEIGRRNLFGKNRSVNLFSRASLRRKNATFDSVEPSERSLGFNEYRVIGTFREPRVFGWAANGQLSAFFEQAIRPSFSFVRRGAQAQLASTLGRGFNVVGSYAYDHTRLFDEQVNEADRPLIDRLFPRVTLSVLSLGTLRDTRDDPLEPTGGTLLGLDQAVAARSLGSEVGFTKSFAQGAFYRKIPAGARTVFAARVQLGLARGFGRPVPTDGAGTQTDEDALRDLPASERFFAGGATTVRGFALDRLGDAATLRDDGFPTGGNALVVLNSEMRFQVWGSLGAAVFVDAGNVFRRVAELDVSELRVSPGFGMRYRSPLGPIRVDVGLKLDRRTFRDGRREQPYALHISIGQAF